MIIYTNNKSGFIDDCRDNMIASKIEDAFRKNNFNHHNDSEYRSWANSMQMMRNIIDDKDIDDECKIAIEYQIPLTSKRVDFIITGCDELDQNNVIVVELKQWETSQVTSRPDVVTTFVGNTTRAVTHPSYQAYSYAKIIENFNESVYVENIKIIPCAYLHNYKEMYRMNIEHPIYNEALKLAPVFLNEDAPNLRNFIKQYIKKKNNIDCLMKIEYGKLKPAKALQDAVASMLKGNEEFYLIDEQKVAYETILKLVKSSLAESKRLNNLNNKYTVIVKGGPGTGKSVVAIKLLCDLINHGYSANYISKNAAPRNVFFEKLRQDKYKSSYVNNLFKGSGNYIGIPNNFFDCLICDEAHRLNAKSGIFQNRGENQIKEIIHASKVSVFFIDEDQRVTTSDIGSIDLIKKFAEEENSMLFYGDDYNLVSQFRCNGSDGYLQFLDNLLNIRETPVYNLDLDYNIRLFNDPNHLREELRKVNTTNKARMVAGYCYNWITKNQDYFNEYDICLENNFKAKWNFSNTQTWAIDKDSFEQVGCIHTCQGLEFDYCGVIIGKDLRYLDNRVITDYTKRAKTDTSLKGIKKSKDFELAERLIKNTYKVLLSRGQKGTYIYCEDKELLKYISMCLNIEIE